jgi:threonine aldolase
MRQAGILAAAGRIALERGPLRLFEDHENAEYLSNGLAKIPELEVNPATTQTNIVYARCKAGQASQLKDYLAEQGILITAGDPIRFVTHQDVSREDVDTLLTAIRQFYPS